MDFQNAVLFTTSLLSNGATLMEILMISRRISQELEKAVRRCAFCNPYFVCLNCPCCSDNTGKSFEIAVKDIESQLAWMSLISSHVSSGKHIVKALRKIFCRQIGRILVQWSVETLQCLRIMLFFFCFICTADSCNSKIESTDSKFIREMHSNIEQDLGGCPEVKALLEIVSNAHLSLSNKQQITVQQIERCVLGSNAPRHS